MVLFHSREWFIMRLQYIWIQCDTSWSAKENGWDKRRATCFLCKLQVNELLRRSRVPLIDCLSIKQQQVHFRLHETKKINWSGLRVGHLPLSVNYSRVRHKSVIALEWNGRTGQLCHFLGATCAATIVNQCLKYCLTTKSPWNVKIFHVCRESERERGREMESERRNKLLHPASHTYMHTNRRINAAAAAMIERTRTWKNWQQVNNAIHSDTRLHLNEATR